MKDELYRDGELQGCPQPIQLIVYVSARFPERGKALEELERLLARYPADRVTLTVFELDREEPDVMRPATVRCSPGPRTFILGHMSNPQLLIDLLADCQPPEC